MNIWLLSLFFFHIDSSIGIGLFQNVCVCFSLCYIVKFMEKFSEAFFIILL